MSPGLSILFILVCLVGTGFYAGMETGVISIHRLRLRHLVRQRVPGADILQDFLDHPDNLLGTTLVGTNIFMVMASISSASLAETHFGVLGYYLSSVAMTIVILICCEYLPKAWFQGRPSARTRPFARVLKLSGYVFYPASRFVISLAKIMIPSRRRVEGATQPFITKEEIKHLIRESEHSGELTPDERRIMSRVMELMHRTCRDIMVPLEKMSSVPHDAGVENVLRLAREKAFSRFPVYQKETGQFIGVLHIYDLIPRAGSGRGAVTDYVRPPQYVSHDLSVDKVLPRMRMNHHPMALVTDERSSVVGLVTIEDVLREIVGTL